MEKTRGGGMRVALVWIAFPFNAAVNLTRGYTLRQSFFLHRIAARVEREGRLF